MSVAGVDEIRAAVEACSKAVQGRFLARLQDIAKLPPNEWHSGYVKPLRGPCAGVSEIRFKADNVQRRPLGYISGPNEFTILFWAEEKGGKFVPANACEKALERKNEVIKDRRRAHALWLALE